MPSWPADEKLSLCPPCKFYNLVLNYGKTVTGSYNKRRHDEDKELC